MAETLRKSVARKVGSLTKKNFLLYQSEKPTGASGEAALPTSDPISHSARKEASCSRCPNRTNENPPYCTWLKAEIPIGLPDDPECEGFPSNNLETKSKDKAETGSTRPVPLLKSKKRVGRVAIGPSKTACPKTAEIQTALKLKGFKGSVIKEKICCGKPGCHCHGGALHGPYPYLHYYSNGKVRRRYLTKAMSALLSHSAKELERMLQKTGTVLRTEGAV